MPDMELYLGDCLEVMPRLPDKSIDAIITDPPYFRVKDEPWDNQWDTSDGFLSWLGLVADEWQRILKPNGSLYVFASPQMAWYVEGVIRERFNVLNRINWVKSEGWHQKAAEDALRCLFPQVEPIVFAEQFNSDNMALGESRYEQKCDELRGFVFEPLRNYLRSEFDRAGVHIDMANVFCGTASMASRHYFTRSQWCLPTNEHYVSLRKGLNPGGSIQYLRREYEDLRREYEDLRRPFNATPNAPYTDVWTYPTVFSYPGKHPCEKPLAMMEHIVNLSTRPGDLILDCFAGSGVTGMAAIRNNRKFVGIEMSEHWFNYTQRRIRDVSRAIDKLPKQLVGLESDTQDLPLFVGAFPSRQQSIT